MFPGEAEGFDDLLALVEKAVANYNEDLADSIERVEKLLGETKDEHQRSRLTIYLAELIESVEGASKEQVAYIVDMAKAEALDLLGENRQAWELVEISYSVAKEVEAKIVAKFSTFAARRRSTIRLHAPL